MYTKNRTLFLIALLAQTHYIMSGHIVAEYGAKAAYNLIPATIGVIAGAFGGFDERPQPKTAFNKTLDKDFPLNSFLQESQQFPLNEKGLVLYYAAAAIANPHATAIELAGDVIKKALILAKGAIPKTKKPESDAIQHAFQTLSYILKFGAEKLAAGTVNAAYFVTQFPRSFFVRSAVPILEKCVDKDNKSLRYVMPFTFIHILGLAIGTTWTGCLLYQIPSARRLLEKLPNYNMFKYGYQNHLQ